MQTFHVLPNTKALHLRNAVLNWKEDYVGVSPLMFAAKGGCIEAAELLLSNSPRSSCLSFVCVESAPRLRRGRALRDSLWLVGARLCSTLQPGNSVSELAGVGPMFKTQSPPCRVQWSDGSWPKVPESLHMNWSSQLLVATNCLRLRVMNLSFARFRRQRRGLAPLLELYRGSITELRTEACLASR